MTNPFSPTFESLRAEIHADLDRFLADRASALPDAALMLGEIGRMLRAGGKRLRPSFCYWGFRAMGGAHGSDIVRAAAGLELLHTFALVHDDIMDRSKERRGVPSVHARHGVDIALLVGDLALVLADEAFMASGFDPYTICAAFVPYSRMRQEVIAGQYLDVAAVERRWISEEDARRIAVLKSGRYSVEEPLLIGATLAGAAVDRLDGLGAFGRPLGEAFQLRDDLLGMFGEPESTGKPVDSDIREGKRNVLYAKALATLEGEDRALLMDRWGAHDLDDRDIARLRELIERTARVETETLVTGLIADARAALGVLVLDPEPRAALDVLIGMATEREG